MQTAGKTYLATSENIACFTNGRFAPKGLATTATMSADMVSPELRPLPQATFFDAHKPAYLLLTPEDLHPESVFGASTKVNSTGVLFDPETLWGNNARAFVKAATEDAVVGLVTLLL